MAYTMYTPLNVWLDPASVTDVVAYIQTYLSENTIYSEEEIEELIHDYLIAHPELIGGVQSVNGKTGTVVLTASDINTANNVTIESVLSSLSSQISSIASSVATNTTNIANLTGRVSTAETDISNLNQSNVATNSDIGKAHSPKTVVNGKVTEWQYIEAQVDSSDVAEAVDNWCDENITNPDSPPLDRSLSASSAAAPADLVGDLKSNTNNITGNEAIPYNYKNNYFNTSGSTFDINAKTESANFHSAVFDCVGGDVFTITASGGTSPRAWAFVDSNNNILSKAYSCEQCDDSIVTAPAGSVKIVINNRIAGNDSAKPNAVSYKGELVRIQLKNVYGVDTEIETIEGAVTEPLYTEETLSFVSATGYYDNVRIFNTYSGVTTATINVSEGEKYYVISRNFGNVAIVCLLDSSDSVVSVYQSKGGDSPQTLEVTIPSGISKLMIQRVENYYPTKIGLITGIRNKKPVSVLNGKRITLIGDSITEHNFRAAVNWPLYLREWCGAVIQNLGVGGTGFYSGSNRYADRIQSIQTPDVIGVALSLNDLTDETFPIGTASDTGTASLAGYANTFFDSLIAAYPTIPIIAYVQSPWGGYKPGTNRSDEWIGVFTQICQLKGVPFYSEMYYGSALKPWISANRAVYYVSDGEGSSSQTDDVHPNSEGHKIIARHLYPHFAENLVTTGLDYQ